MDPSTGVKLHLKYKRALELFDEKCGSDAVGTACNHLASYVEKTDEAYINMADGDSKDSGDKKSKKEVPMHESNLTMYIVLWMYLPGIALICCCCNGCEHFEGGRKEEDEAEFAEITKETLIEA